MKFISLFFVVYLFLKSFNYGLFELNEKKNFIGGFFIITLSFITLVFSLILLFVIN